MTLMEDVAAYIVKSNGHWANKGWVYDEKKFIDPAEAWSFYSSAGAPKAVSVLFIDGFRADLSDKGMAQHFSGFMQGA